MADTHDIAARLVPDLMRELGLSREQALGLVGNLAHESMGFRDLTENGVKGRGGYGYAQWTGNRRTKFENYAKAQGLKPSSYEANLGFIVKELKGSEKAALKKIKSATTADQAASVAMTSYFRPGKPQLNSRQNWTDQFAASLPNSALSAINAVAPTPMPSRPVALGYSQNTAIPSVPAPRSSAPPGMKSLIDGNAAFGVLPFDTKPDPASYAPNYGIDLNARDLNPPIVPKARGVGTPSLAPATKVQTYKVDNLGNPIMPKSALQAATEAKAARIASGAEKFTPTVPVAQPPRLPSGWVPAVTQGTQAAGSVQLPAGVRPKAVDDAFRQIAASQTAPVAPVPRAKPVFPVALAPTGTYTPAPAPVDLLAKADQSRLPKGTYDPGGDAIMQALYPKPATSPAVSAINAATLPRLPMMPSPAMSAARLPTVPVRTAPIAPARTPLPQTRTVNPMTQIVPAVQARAGQGLLGGLLNMLTAGNVPQANTQQRQPQQYPMPIPGQTGVEINGVDLAFMPKSVQQSTRWRTGY